MNLNPSNIVSKISSKADTIGKLFGYLAPMAAVNPADPINSIIQEHIQIIKYPHVPSLQNIQWHFENFGRPTFEMGVTAYLAGEILSMFSSKEGNAVKKFGESAAKYSLFSTVVMSLGRGGGNSPYAPAPMGRSIETSRGIMQYEY